MPQAVSLVLFVRAHASPCITHHLGLVGVVTSIGGSQHAHPLERWGVVLTVVSASVWCVAGCIGVYLLGICGGW
jgi:hypothetical protein